jgi:Tol biopolymer transport system component
MMPADRFERQLPELLDQVGMTRTPDYFEDLLAKTAGTRQRPGWTFPGRWIPILDVAREPLIKRSVPWRQIVILVLAALLLAATLVFVIGSRRTPAPPFGPARNGLIAYASDGDIYTGDPVTGVSKLIIAGPENDEFPSWSLDGTRLAFIRQTGSTDDGLDGLLFAADADGGNLTPVIPKPVTAMTGFEFSPDGRSIVLSSTVGRRQEITIASTSGLAPRILDIYDRLPATFVPDGPSYRPLHEAEIMFAAWKFIGSEYSSTGIYLVNDDGSDLRPLVKPDTDVLLFHPVWSPDGLKVAYTRVPAGDLSRWELHVLVVDDMTDRTLDTSDAPSEGWPAWSPDGARFLIQRSSADGSTGAYAVVPSDGSGPGIEIQNAGAPIGATYVWAPDGTAILAIPDHDPSRLLIWDPNNGTTTTQPWTSGNFYWQGRFPAWQRLAPIP